MRDKIKGTLNMISTKRKLSGYNTGITENKDWELSSGDPCLEV